MRTPARGLTGDRGSSRWHWALGVAASVAAIGPGLGRGSLLSLDLVFTPTVHVPPGIWGLGPELPRRVPLGAPLAWLGSVVGGEAAGKLLLVAVIAVAVAGGARLASAWGASPAAAAGAGLLYGAGPFALTRLGAGQWGLLAATALLPWVAPRLLRPADHLGRTFLAAAALGLTGFAGGGYALLLVLVGGLTTRPRPRAALAAGGAALLAQLPWLVPGVIVTAAGAEVNGAADFPTRVDDLGGLLRVVVGHGFWRRSNDVGVAGAAAAVAGALALVAAARGWRQVPDRLRTGAAWCAAVGFGVAVATGIPGVRRVYAALTEVPPGAAFRESHRALPLLLLWLAPAAAAGVTAWSNGRRIAARLAPAALLTAAVALVAPAWWGIGGRLEPATLPDGLVDAKRVIDERPGTVLALPWHQYLDLSFAGGRRVLNPLPDVLGGDVLASADPELGEPRREDADRRGRRVDQILRSGDRHAPRSPDLARLGVRWVVLVEEVEWREVLPELEEDDGLRAVGVGRGARLFEVRSWVGPAVDAFGAPVEVDGIVGPLQRVEPGGPSTWSRSGSAGWVRGGKRATVTDEGLLAVPDGAGYLWYWPALLVLAGDAITLAGVGASVRSLSSRKVWVTVDP